MATSIDQKNFVKTALRLPPELHAAVHEAAQKNGRSYNAELVERVQRSFETEERAQADELMREMRRTQLHLERAELRAQYGYLFERGSAAARELAKMREGSSTLEVKELEAIVNSVRIDKSHLDAKIAAIDARLGELSPRAKP
jgi:hypothetical protein